MRSASTRKWITGAAAAAVMTVGAAAQSHAATVLSYHDGGTSQAPIVEASFIDAGNSDLNGSESWRVSWGGAGATPAGPTAGSAPGSNWRLYRSVNLNDSINVNSDYAGFSFNYTGGSKLALGSLTFDYVMGTDVAGGGLIGQYEVFAQVNGGGFTSIGSGATAPVNGTDVFGPVNTPTVNLDALPLLTAGDNVEVRIAFADNSGGTLGNSKGLFVQGIELDAMPVAKRYQIDIDSTDGGGGPIETASGWTSLNATGSSNSTSVTVDGVTFAPFSADGSRVRRAAGEPNPNPLTSDFIFDDGPGEAVGLFFGGAGDLEKGTWLVELWINDADFNTGEMIVGYRTNTSETIIATDVLGGDIDPAIAFTFISDGVSAYDVFVRENNANNNTRLNAVRLTLLVPAPAALPAGLALMALVATRRRGARTA